MRHQLSTQTAAIGWFLFFPAINNSHSLRPSHNSFIRFTLSSPDFPQSTVVFSSTGVEKLHPLPPREDCLKSMYTTLLSLCCLASFRSVISEPASDIDPVTPQYPKHALIVDGATVSPTNRLAVVVPTHRGELPRAVSSLQRWPSSCSPVTKRSVDLVLYYAEGDEDSAVVAEAVQAIAATAGLCFATTRVVYANVNEEVR